MATKAEVLARVKKQQADPAYLHAVDPNFAKTGFTLGDTSKLKTVSVIDPYAIPDEYGNLNNDFSYQEDPYGQRVGFSANQGVDNEGNPQGSPEYRQLTNVGGKQVQVFYDDKGNFKSAIGDDITKNGHKYTPIYDQKGNIVQYADAGGDGFGDFVKMAALSALTAGLGGAAGLGESLYGLTGTAGSIAGGATLGAGKAALTGGNLQDILKSAALGGLGGAGSVNIGGTGFTVGDLTKAANVLQAAKSGDMFSAITGAANMSGLSTDIPIGNTGYTLSDLTKNAKLAQAVLSGNPQAVISAITKFSGMVQANSTNTPTEDQVNARNKDFIDSLSPYESKNPNALLDLAVGNQQKSAEADQPAIDARTQDIIKQLEKAGVPIDEAATDWAALYAQETTDPVTGKTIKGVDVSTYAPQNLNIDPAQWDSYTKNLQSIIDKGGYTSQWQTVGTDRIMVQDDGTAIATNENGDPYSLTKTQVDQMVQNGILNTANSGYVAATGGTGNNPGGTKTTTTPVGGTKTTTPATQTTTPTASTPTASAPTTTRVGLDPLDVAKMKNDVAHIKAMEELFGGSIYDQTPASSAHDQTDIVEAATGGQVYSGGGDIHALLQLLRS
jgi:hypothetical protein